MSTIDQLMAFQRETAALAAVAGRTGWDQETVMPKGAAAQRGEEMAALEAVLHARRSDPRVGEWLEYLPGDLDEAHTAQVREIRRSYDRACKMPADLAKSLARVTSLSQGEWANARTNEDFQSFVPRLTEVVSLQRDAGAALSDGSDPYDALLQDYEPGATQANIAGLFDTMRPRLVALADFCAGSSRTFPTLKGHFEESAQLDLSGEIAVAFGYDLNRGRIDKAVHPFSSGSGTDVRITTRTDPKDPFNCIYSTIHETGHATYEQNVDAAYALTSIGRGASMGVHESQSRIYENQFGRSRAFSGWLFERMKTVFGEFGITEADVFFGAVNRVAPGFIRTEADEVHYNLHIMMRFDLERDLIAGTLQVADLEERWNTRFQEDFGRTVPKPSLGVLQDVHWPVGLFGYFPTYALGNVYAGDLYESLNQDLGDFEAEFSVGSTDLVRAWLKSNLQRFGALRSPDETMRFATKRDPSPEPLLTYLETKFQDIYG